MRKFCLYVNNHHAIVEVHYVAIVVAHHPLLIMWLLRFTKRRPCSDGGMKNKRL